MLHRPWNSLFYCLTCNNCVVNTIAKLCKNNPMACAGKNDRFLLNSENRLEVNQMSEWVNRYTELSDSVKGND